MKRVQKSPDEPELLARYKQRYPHDTWEKFHHRSRDGYRQVKRQLLRDQHGLCAYCEINIKLTDEEDRVDDFRVEQSAIIIWNGRTCWEPVMEEASPRWRKPITVFPK